LVRAMGFLVVGVWLGLGGTDSRLEIGLAVWHGGLQVFDRMR